LVYRGGSGSSPAEAFAEVWLNRLGASAANKQSCSNTIESKRFAHNFEGIGKIDGFSMACSTFGQL
jgi:hypothetical protein